MTRKILVIANETAAGDELDSAVRGPDDGSTEVLVVAPAADAARGRMHLCVEHLSARGFRATGTVGESDPLQATLDALHGFAADEVVILAHPEHRSNLPANRLVERVAEQYDGPILHVGARCERALMAA
jgi:hypothetical protein